MGEECESTRHHCKLHNCCKGLPCHVGHRNGSHAISFVCGPRVNVSLGSRPGSMPAGESPLFSPGVPLVRFVTGTYKLLLLEVIPFGQGPFPLGRSQGPHFPLRVSPLCGSICDRSGLVPQRAVALTLSNPSSPEGVSVVKDDIPMLCRQGGGSSGEVQGPYQGIDGRPCSLC